MRFTNEEKRLLEEYVSNTDRNIFVVNIPGLSGAIFARYSRTRSGIRETLLKEFIAKGQLNVEKADSLIERVLISFGDDSVGELEGIHLAVEQISNLATKVIEDKRRGISPIEQSSRYVFYDQKDEQERFKFLLEPRIMKSKYSSEYEKTMSFCFFPKGAIIQADKVRANCPAPI